MEWPRLRARGRERERVREKFRGVDGRRERRRVVRERENMDKERVGEKQDKRERERENIDKERVGEKHDMIKREKIQ